MALTEQRFRRSAKFVRSSGARLTYRAMVESRLTVALTLGSLLSVVALLPGAPADARAVAKRPSDIVPIGTNGRIGPVRIDRAGKAKIIAARGEPAAEGWGVVTSDYPAYESLGYSCRIGEGRGLFPVGDPGGPYSYCRTVYFVDQGTGRLAALFTSDPAYRGPRGVHPGMGAREAERHLRRRAMVGCWTGIELGAKRSRASLLIAVEGGRVASHGNRSTLIGGRIAWFSLESVRHPVGLQFC